MKCQGQQATGNEQKQKQDLKTFKKKEKDFMKKINELQAEIKSEKSNHEFTNQSLMAAREKNSELQEELNCYKQNSKQQQDTLQQIQQQTMEFQQKINTLRSQVTQ